MKTPLALAVIPFSLIAAYFAAPDAVTEVSAVPTAGPTTEPAVELVSSLLSFDPANTALVVTDPQNDFLSPDGVAWGVVGESVVENDTVANIDALFKAAKSGGYETFISPHYYFPHDKHWHFEGTLEALMHKIGMFDREDALSLKGFEGSGADWLEQYKPYIEDGATVVTSPHKVYGPETNDLVLQLRKRGISRVILAGMSANLCTESHMRELLEQGFDVTVVSDATAAAKTPDLGDGYAAAITNFKFMANAVVETKEAVAVMGKGSN
ncbi:MAG: nicotinamidase-related amidase [Planctomycetota bacterium]|jgi:nicotinamidase-related amidase